MELKATQIKTSSATTSSQLTPNQSAKPILTLELTPILIDVEAAQTKTTSPTISTEELKDALNESASLTMSNMPTPYSTNRPMLTLEPTPVPQPNLHANQTKTITFEKTQFWALST
jgi:hypothetical protein